MVTWEFWDALTRQTGLGVWMCICRVPGCEAAPQDGLPSSEGPRPSQTLVLKQSLKDWTHYFHGAAAPKQTSQMDCPGARNLMFPRSLALGQTWHAICFRVGNPQILWSMVWGQLVMQQLPGVCQAAETESHMSHGSTQGTVPICSREFGITGIDSCAQWLQCSMWWGWLGAVDPGGPSAALWNRDSFQFGYRWI